MASISSTTTTTTTISTTTNHRLHHPTHHFTTLSFSSPTHFPPLKPISSKPTFLTFSSLNPPPPQPPLSPLPTQTILSLFTLTLKITHTLLQKIKSLVSTPTPHELNTIQYLQDNVFCTLGPLFFAAVKDRSSSSVYLNTPLTVVAAGMAKWLDIYSGVLLVRVLLSWFPNIPWDRQPLSAIRDLCDPYLNLFRNIVPPVFGTLDISPLFAFTVLGVLGSILNGAKGI